MLCRGGVRGLVLAARVGVQAAFERHEISEKLKRNQMHKSSEPFRRLGDRQYLFG